MNKWLILKAEFIYTGHSRSWNLVAKMQNSEEQPLLAVSFTNTQDLLNKRLGLFSCIISRSNQLLINIYSISVERRPSFQGSILVFPLKFLRLIYQNPHHEHKFELKHPRNKRLDWKNRPLPRYAKTRSWIWRFKHNVVKATDAKECE